MRGIREAREWLRSRFAVASWVRVILVAGLMAGSVATAATVWAFFTGSGLGNGAAAAGAIQDSGRRGEARRVDPDSQPGVGAVFSLEIIYKTCDVRMLENHFFVLHYEDA